MTTVLVFGTFDIVHKGHIHFFNQAKKLGDKLIAVIARDDTVKQVKGKDPLHNENQRKHDVELIPAVGKAVIGYKGDKYKIIEEIKPDIIALGYDQTAFIDKLEPELKKRNLNIKIVRLKPFKEHNFKSSKLKQVLPK